MASLRIIGIFNRRFGPLRLVGLGRQAFRLETLVQIEQGV